jgi:hypothetical protein
MKMARFIFIMQHALTPDQRAAAEQIGEIVELADKSLLNVPSDPDLPREWFVQRAEEILAAVGGVQEGDILHAMGQYQLTNALNAAGRRAGARLVESTTERVVVETVQPDGTVKKEVVFKFVGFRPVYEF